MPRGPGRLSQHDVCKDIVAAIADGELTTRELVLISYALAKRGSNTTSIVGQYGEELVAAPYGGTIGSFEQKGYDFETPTGERLQVKTYTKGLRPGVIRSFAYDVVTVEVDPATATVLRARRYAAAVLHAEFRIKWETKYSTSTRALPPGAAGPRTGSSSVGPSARASPP